MRSKFLEDGKVLSLFYAIIKQFDILSESHDIDVTVGYKNIFNLCLNVSNTLIISNIDHIIFLLCYLYQII